MSVYLGTELLSGIATNTISNGHTLFDFKWTDHTISSMEWTRSDTFSWQDGEVYVEAFAHLEADFQNGTDESETIGSYTIDYVLAPDGHKIVQPNMETTVANIFDETGVAWYYVLDRVNDRFKLPRTKYGFNGLRDEVGNYIAAGLPNITGGFNEVRSGSSGTGWNGAIKKDAGNAYSYSGWSDSGGSRRSVLTFDASHSNAIYGNSTTVQPPATQMYLYFYVGQFSQSATEQTAGLNASLFNGKVDTDSSWGFPSGTYDDLTLLASGGTYTAPANGWFYFSKKATAANQWAILENTTANMSVGGNVIASGQYPRFIMPCKKGDTITVEYNLAGDTMWFRFIYAVKTN